MNHEDFLQSIAGVKRGLAPTLGWKCQWHWRSFHSPAGWPDLVMVRGKRVIVAELKIPPDKVTSAQAEWLQIWVDTEKAEVYVWTPDDFDEIVEILGGEA